MADITATATATVSLLALYVTYTNGERSHTNILLYRVSLNSLFPALQLSCLRLNSSSKALWMIVFGYHHLALATTDGAVRLANGMFLESLA